MNIVSFDNYPHALDYLADKLGARKFDPREYYIVIAPDRYTQTLESRLFGSRGAIDAEVITLSRLARRVAPAEKTLSQEGGVMITARAVAAVKDKLGYYARAASFTDFARRAYFTLQQIAASDTAASALSGDGVTKLKLDDLKVIAGEYEKIKSDYRDAADRLSALIDAVPSSELIRGAHIYAIGYSLGKETTTRLNLRLFSVIERYARSFEFICAREPAPRKELRLFAAPDDITEYKEVACRIRDLADNGGYKYGDMSVVCAHPRALSRILNEYGIEFYTDEAEPLFDTPPLAAISHIYSLKKSADSAALVSLCLNPYSGCDARDAEMLLNCFEGYGTVYNVFDKTLPDDGAMRALRRAEELVNAFTGGFADAVRAVIEKGEFFKVRDLLAQSGGKETDEVSPILALADICERYGSGDFDTDASGFFAAAHSVQVKSLPRKQDRVTVTRASALRLSRCPVLFVTDFNEGVTPAVTEGNGLLCDGETDEINSHGAALSPTVFERNRSERTELKAAIANAETVFCSYSGAGGQRSSLIGELAETTDCYEYDSMREMLYNSGDENVGFLTLYAPVESAARELCSRGMLKHAASVRAAVGDAENVAPPFDCELGRIDVDRISVSELQKYFECPYKRFLTYSVGLTERRTQKTAAIDFGMVVHAFMEEFLRVEPYDFSREAVERVLAAAMRRLELEADEREFARLADDATDFARDNVKILKAGRYRVKECEKKFAVPLITSRGEIEFKGTIDRIDTCDGRVRIIDYKTYKKSFSLGKCHDGTDMQLPLYAYACGKENVDGVYYVMLLPRCNTDNIKLMSGRTVADARILRDNDGEMFERADETPTEYAKSEYFSAAVKKDGDDYKPHGNYSAPIGREKFDAIIDDCVANASSAADEICGGYIERTPNGKACEHCAYNGICGYGKILRNGGEDEEND